MRHKGLMAVVSGPGFFGIVYISKRYVACVFETDTGNGSRLNAKK